MRQHEGDAFWFNRVHQPLSKICTNLAGVQSSIWERPLPKNETMLCLSFKAYANIKMLLKIWHIWWLKISIIPENLTDFGHIKKNNTKFKIGRNRSSKICPISVRKISWNSQKIRQQEKKFARNQWNVWVKNMCFVNTN